MKTKLLLAMFAVLAVWRCSAAEPPAATQSDNLDLQTGRPRLFFRDKAWEGGLSLAQLRERANVEPFKGSVRLLRTTRANLALKWLMTGDEQAAAEALAAIKSFNARLETSEEGSQLVDVALAYDWLYAWPKFSADDKKQIEGRMVALAREMIDSLLGEGGHVFHTRMYSWVAGAGMVGLAVHDVNPEGRALFAAARKYYEEQLWPARVLQGGAIHNGLSYGPNYMMFPLIQFLEAAKSGAGIDYFHHFNPNTPITSEWLRRMSAFLIQCIQPDMKHVRYADVSTNDPAKHFRFMLDIFAAEYKDGYAAEMARRIGERFKGSGYHAEWIYLFFAFHDPSVAPKPLDDMPRFESFSPDGVGHIFWRSDWTENATTAHFRCGDYFENHGHFDQGAFTVFRRGGLAIQSGGYWGFDTPHRHRYYKQAISTNNVIFNDPDDPKDESQQRNVNYQKARTFADYLDHKKAGAEPNLETGNILALDAPAWVTSTGKDFHYVVADVTPAWNPEKVKRFVRTLAFVDNKHIVVVDATETTKPSIRARWLLHSQVEPTPFSRERERARNAAGKHDANKVWSIALPQSSLLISILEPVEPKVTLIGGEGRECEVNGVNYPYTNTEKYLSYHKGQKDLKPEPTYGLWRMEVEAAKPSAYREFVTVLTAGDADVKPPAIEAIRSKEGLTVRIDGTAVTFKKPGGIDLSAQSAKSAL